MDHWFDNLSRSLGKQALTRRSMISWTTRLGFAAGFGLTTREATTASAAPVEAPINAPVAAPVNGPVASPAFAASPCTVEDTYGVLKTVITASGGDAATPLTLTHTFTTEVGSGTSTATLTVTPGPVTSARAEDIVLRMSTVTLANKQGHASASFGKRYTGASLRRTDFHTDGRTVRGATDGRDTEESPLGSDVRGIKFKDAQPAKALTEGAQATSVQQAVSALLAQAKGQLGTCSPDPKAPKEIALCTSCQLACRRTWIDCSISAAQASLAAGALAPGAYLNTASATCDSAFQACLSTCKSSGACCPDYCKGDAACCQSAWGCAPPSGTSKKSWSRVWPTCTRAGTPPWPAAAKVSAPRITPVRPPRRG